MLARLVIDICARAAEVLQRFHLLGGKRRGLDERQARQPHVQQVEDALGVARVDRACARELLDSSDGDRAEMTCCEKLFRSCLWIRLLRGRAERGRDVEGRQRVVDLGAQQEGEVFLSRFADGRYGRGERVVVFVVRGAADGAVGVRAELGGHWAGEALRGGRR